MRAGLHRGRIRARRRPPASPAVAAPAQVPCTDIGGGHYECNWYRAGNGFSGGSLVVVGTHDRRLSPPGQELDHLPAGRGRHAQPRGQQEQLVRLDPGRERQVGLGQPARRRRRRRLRLVRRRDAELQRRVRLAAVVERRLGLAAARHAGRDPDPPLRARRPGTPTRTASRRTRATATTPTRTSTRARPRSPGDGVDQDCSGADAAGRLSAIVRL